jgi:ABC-type lipoprotein export system ATPase subunit
MKEPLIPFPVPAKGTVVRTVNLKKTYGVGTANPVTVLHGVNMEAKAGEFVAIIGQSGSGKSTLLNILGALDVPTTGEVLIDGTNIAALDADGLARLRGKTIGFIFQFHHLLDEFNCLENALMPVTIAKGAPSPDDVAYAKMLLGRVGLADQLDKKPGQLSGGQQQRNAIVRALVNKPKVVLADEPTGNLDSRSGAECSRSARDRERDRRRVPDGDPRRPFGEAGDRVLRMEDGFLLEPTVK